MQKRIIGVCGLKGSGKDTFADFICNQYDFYEKMSFANILKDLTSVLFTWDRELLQGSTEESREWREKEDEFWSKELGRIVTPRIALQQLGTEIFRNHFHKDIWIIALKKRILESQNDIIITDVRFPNEIDMIKKLGGTIIRIERGELPEWFNTAANYNCFNTLDPIPEVLKNIHPSEWKWIGYDEPQYIVKNNGTKEDLRKEALRIAVELLNLSIEHKDTPSW